MKKTEEFRKEIKGSSSYMKRPPSSQRHPWLVYKHGRKDEYQTFCSLRGSRYTQIGRRRIPELRNKTIFACSFGWVVLLDEKDDYYLLWNPVTSETIDLPPLELKKKDHYIHYCLLTAPPGHSNCKVLLFSGNYQSVICCQLIGNTEWNEIGYYTQLKNNLKEEEEDIKERILTTPISCNGKIYALLTSHLLCIQVDESNNITVSLVTSVPKPQRWISPGYRDYLVESLDEIFYMHFYLVEDQKVIHVDVFKLDVNSMIWGRITSAKDRAFFLGGDYNISCHVHSSLLKGSRVYFTRGDKNVYSFNMEDQSIMVTLPCPDLPTPYNPNANWIMPDIVNLVDEGAEAEKDLLNNGKERTEKKEDMVEEGEKSNLLDLPWLPLRKVARHLPLVDYMNFRVVNKACCSVAPLLRWKTEFRDINLQLKYPWFIFPKYNEGIYHLVEPRLNIGCFLTIPDSLRHTTIRCSKDGWLLMSRERNFTLFNPFTKDIIRLPDIPDYAIFGNITFTLTCSPPSPDCYIIGVDQLSRRLGVSIIRPGENEWQFVPFELEKPLDRAHGGAIYFGEKFYIMDHKGMLQVLDIRDEIKWESLDKPESPCKSFHHNYLVECDGDLLSVFVGGFEKSIQVYKLNFSELIWEKVSSLKDYALYLCTPSSFSAQVKTHGMANRIYFPWNHNEKMVFYSLNTTKFHALEGEFLSTTYLNAAMHLNCSWIQPS